MPEPSPPSIRYYRAAREYGICRRAAPNAGFTALGLRGGFHFAPGAEAAASQPLCLFGDAARFITPRRFHD